MKDGQEVGGFALDEVEQVIAVNVGERLRADLGRRVFRCNLLYEFDDSDSVSLGPTTCNSFRLTQNPIQY